MAQTRRMQPARNVILFVADGMSIPTITAARIYDGQSRGQSGVENRLAMDGFPDLALIRTYNSDAQVPDSASTASALLTGHKTRTGAISVRPDQGFEACSDDADLPPTLFEMAEDRGLATGVVSTARITHATPASAYAHSLSREWEADGDMPEAVAMAGCRDIARQLIEFSHGDGIDIALGGGARSFLPVEAGGGREDGRDLLAEWENSGGQVLRQSEALYSLSARADGPVLGLFADSHLPFDADRVEGDPSLADLTVAAIERLSASDNGYVLMVEAGRVDHAHHATNAFRALTDMVAYDQAIAAAVDRVDLEDTLIIVTADHGHVMTMIGYPARDNPILGLVRHSDPRRPGSEPELMFGADGKPYTTLNYQNGPNVRLADGPALTDEQVLDPNYRQQTAIRSGNESHSGSDVALFANGPRSFLFGGSLEQNSVFHLITYAMGWQDVQGATPERTRQD